MNAVIYARYSSHNQTEQSIEGQLRDCYEYAKRNEYTVIGEYIDRAISGNTDERPDFQRMIKDASKRQFERVIVWKLDRFARNRYDSATYKHKLKQYGVKVVSAMENVGEGDESVLLEALLEASAEYYSLDLKKKINRGLRESALKGTYVGGVLPFGYYVNAERKLCVDEKTAPIVRYCFEEYGKGTSSQLIIDHLNERGIRSAKGLPIGHSWLKHVLKNRKYIGEYIFNGIPVAGGCPALIDAALFEKVQGKIAAKRRAGGAATAKVEYLLQGKIYCGLCGSPITAESGRNGQGVVYNYYACAKKKKAHACQKANERKDFLEWYIVEQTLEYVLTPGRIDYIANAIVAAYEREFDKAGIAALEQKVARIEGEIQNAMDACIQATTEAMRARFMARCEQLDVQKADVEIDLAKLRVAAAITYTVEEVTAWLRQFCKGDALDMDVRRRIIDTFINAVYLYDDKVIIYYNIKDGRQVSYIEAIDAPNELENLQPVPEGIKKANGQTLKSSTVGLNGGAYRPTVEHFYIVAGHLFGLVAPIVHDEEALASARDRG